jgi:acetyl-CoA synthetase
MLGRTDDVIKVSGHRIGNMELEDALVSHPAVAEAVAVGVPDKVKGEAIIACVVLKDKYLISSPSSFAYYNNLKNEIIKTVEETVGKFARPREVKFLKDLPKTRTGKLVRRLVRMKILSNNCIITQQDLSTIENPSSLEEISKEITNF